MSYKDLRERKLRFSDSLNGQRWIFLKKGLDDFRDGFPPSSDNMIVYGRKRPVSITLQNGTLKSLSTVLRKKRNYSKMQVCLSKLSLLQRARRDYVAQIECCLKQSPVVLYPCLGKSTSPKLFREDTGVLDPEVLLKSKAGYGVCEQENQPLQDMLHHMEDEQSKVTASKTGKESGSKTLCMWLSKKRVAGREKEAVLAHFAPPDENMKRAIKNYCDWVLSLGGGNHSMDERTLMSLLNTSYEREATVPSPFRAVNLNKVEAEKLKSKEISPPRLAVWSSHHLKSLPCQVKELEVTQLHSTQAFKEFLERKGYRKPRFLPKMLAGGNDSRPPEKTSKACKNISKER